MKHIIITLFICCFLLVGCVSTNYVTSPHQYAEINEQGLDYRANITVKSDLKIMDFEGDSVKVDRDSVHWLDPTRTTLMSAATSTIQRIQFTNYGIGALEGLGIGAASGIPLILIGLAIPHKDPGGIPKIYTDDFLMGFGATLSIVGIFVGGIDGNNSGHKTDYIFLNADALKADEEMVLKILDQDGLALQYVSNTLKDDKDVVLTAVKQDGFALQYGSARLQGEREIVLNSLLKNGMALQYAGAMLKNDPVCVSTAVNRNGLALQYSSDDMKDNKEIVITAVSQNGLALQFASDKLKNDKDVVLKAVKRNGRALAHASDERKDDKDIVLEALLQDATAIEFVSERLKTDRDFLRMVNSKKR